MNCKKVRIDESSDVFSKKPPKFSQELSFIGAEKASVPPQKMTATERVFYHLGNLRDEEYSAI